MTEEDIAAGQIWTYRCRTSEEGSRITVFKIDSTTGNIIVHARIDGLTLVNKITREVVGNSIEHLPIDLKAFKESVLELESFIATSITEGYWVWKMEFDAGKAGVWSANVSDVVALIEDTLTQNTDRSD